MPPKKPRGRGKPQSEPNAERQEEEDQAEPQEIPSPTAPSSAAAGVARGRGRARPTRQVETPLDQQGAVGGVAEVTRVMQEKFVFAERKPIENAMAICKRPGIGKLGGPIDLVTNHFNITLDPTKMSCVYQYDVDIKRVNSVRQRKLNREDAHEVYWDAVKTTGQAVGLGMNDVFFDRQKIMFSLKNYGRDAIVLTTSEQYDRASPWEVKIKSTGIVNPVDYKNAVYDANLYERDRVHLQAIDLVVRQGILFNDMFTCAGRSFFAVEQKLDLGCGKEMLKGFYLSTRVIDNWQITLNVDMTTAVFLKIQPLMHMIAENLGIRGSLPPTLQPHQIMSLKKHLKDVAVKTTHIARKFKIERLSNETAHTYKFIVEKDGRGEAISVFDYFKREYNITLRYPHWPLVKQRGGRMLLFPVEVCEIAKNNRVKNKQMSVMDQESAIPPIARKEMIQKMLRMSGIEGDERLKNFGVSVAMQMTTLTGRVLDPPKLEYHNRAQLTPKPGEWDIQRNRLFAPAPVKSWAIVNLDPWNLNEEKIKFFVENLINAGRSLGMPQFELPRQIVNLPSNWPDMNIQPFVKKEFLKLSKEIPDMELLMVIMWDKNTPAYADVKHHSENIIDVVSQCLRSELINQTWIDARGRKSTTTLANIIFKINKKMGGVNSQIDRFNPIAERYLNKPVLIVGADVTHPDPGDENSPSIAGICGNIDSHPSHYVAVQQVQVRRMEMIVGLKAAIAQLLKAYYKNTRMKPVQIIMYRDGVSEGQFAEVLEYELKAIQAACSELEKGYKPGVTFIVVQKRHHTRFFRRNMNAADKAPRQNIPAGTVVDKGVVHPVEFDFYLCSHIGIQGTSKPSHYHVLWDDNVFTADDLQQLTYYLCYTYARCTRSVSIPAPVYYAHHIAYRARYRLMSCRAVLEDSDEGSIASGVSGGNLNGNNQEDVVKMNEMIKSGPRTVGREYWQ